MSKSSFKQLRQRLIDERKSLVERASRTLAEDATFDTDELPDEIDQASKEYSQAMVFRFRDREKYYLDKIDRALKKIDAGTFGVCEDCEEPISSKRLEARPVTTLCVMCKEEQEMKERSYGG